MYCSSYPSNQFCNCLSPHCMLPGTLALSDMFGGFIFLDRSWTYIFHRRNDPRHILVPQSFDVCFVTKTLKIFGRSCIAFWTPSHQTKLNSYSLIMCFSWYNFWSNSAPQYFSDAALGDPVSFVPSTSTCKHPKGNLLEINSCSTTPVISVFANLLMMTLCPKRL